MRERGRVTTCPKILLGEVNPDELFDTTIDPDKRTLIKLKYEDDNSTKDLMNDLFGTKVDNRRRMYEEQYML